MPLALLEHLNLNVPDRAAAHAFYVVGLGGKENPKSTNELTVTTNDYHHPGPDDYNHALRTGYEQVP